MPIDVLSPLGRRLTGVDLSRDDDLPVEDAIRLLAEGGVLVIPDQRLDDARFVAFLRRFGDLAFTAGETPVEGFPDLNVVTNVGRDRPPRSVFHVDTTYVPVPPAYTALRVVEVPDQGGATVFSDQYRALETLPATLREAVTGREIEHASTDGAGHTESAWHPAVLTHPVSGRDALFLSTPQRCTRVSGMSDQDAGRLIERLYVHSQSPELLFTHAWAPGDVVMWDNRCVMHKADHSGVVGARTLHRGMITAPARRAA